MGLEFADWAAFAEIFGAVAIVVSLIFVGYQIRGNTRATQAATFQEHMGYEIDFVTRVGSSPDVAAVWETTQRDFESLTGVQKVQGTYLFLGAMRLWEGFFLQWRAGTLSEEGWKAREQIVRSFAMLPMPHFGGASREGEVFSGAFMEYIRQVRREEGLDPV